MPGAHSPGASIGPAFPGREGRRAGIVVGALGVAALASFLAACMAGSVTLPVGDMMSAAASLARGEEPGLAATLLALRAGRALTAFATGAALALAGAMMQALLRNPLADPYVLGVSGGAAVGALAAMLTGATLWVVDASAFAGATAISVILYVLARRDVRGTVSSDPNASSLLLTGVILGTGCGALVTLMLSIASDNQLRGMVFWLIGDLSGAQWRWLPWLALSAALLFALRSARAINLLAQHANNAMTLGVAVVSLRQGLFLASALLTASAVTSAGSIGFVGLIVPHACRFAFGPDHRILLPAATLAGGSFLVVADTLARTWAAPQQLPVGVITALIGVPVFLLQLHRRRKF